MPIDLSAILQETKYPGNTIAFHELNSFMQSGTITAFTGAGASAPTFPTWSSLLSGLIFEASDRGFLTEPEAIRDCRRLIQDDPLELASTLEDVFTKRNFRARLADIFRNSKNECTKCHEIIADLHFRGLVTLNYDNGHEVAFSNKGVHVNASGPADAVLSRWIDGKAFEDLTPPILHLHGEVSNPERMVLTSDDYSSFYSTVLAEGIVKHLWLSHRLLAIGFGFSDPFLTRVAEQTLRTFDSSNLHFALIGRRNGEGISSLQRKMFTKKYRLTPIFYDVIETVGADDKIRQDHSALTLLLSALPKPSPSTTLDVTSDGKTALVVHRQPPASISTGEASDAKIEFERELFVLPNKTAVYVEPHLAKYRSITTPNSSPPPEFSIQDIVNNTDTFVIVSRPELGATTLAKRLVLEFSTHGKKVLFRSATSLPNYRKKIEQHFEAIDPMSATVLIVDDVDFSRDDRLIKELAGTKLFSRLILIARENLFDVGSVIPTDQIPSPVTVLSITNYHRGDIRAFANAFFETSDADTLEAIVDQVYRDLIALCIPITPANIIMYLTILYREGDFHPINRVQIVSRYLSEVLRRPSDAFVGTFNARDKMNVLSAFVFRLFEEKNASFNEADWYVFCRDYMKAKLSRFDDRTLLNDLLAAKILVRVGAQIAFKYSFFYIFFLGRYLSGRPELLSKFIAEGLYIQHSGLTEVIAELAPDNSVLFADITTKLKQVLDEFDTRYLPEEFDPFGQIEWSSDEQEEEKLWKPLSAALSKGPRNPAELDQIKRTLTGENRANNQTVVFQEYSKLEQRLISLQMALTEALRNCDTIDGALKRDAVLTALRAYLKYYQVAMVLAPILAEKHYFVWHGILFVFESPSSFDEIPDKNKKIMRVMHAFRIGVLNKIADEVGSKKLGEVFKSLAKDPTVSGIAGLMNFACLIRSKPYEWLDASQDKIANTGRREYNLRTMLNTAFKEFREEVNTGNEREQLKKLIATIRFKRDKKKDHPSEKDVAKVVSRLEEADYFDPPKAQVEHIPKLPSGLDSDQKA